MPQGNAFFQATPAIISIQSDEKKQKKNTNTTTPVTKRKRGKSMNLLDLGSNHEKGNGEENNGEGKRNNKEKKLHEKREGDRSIPES